MINCHPTTGDLTASLLQLFTSCGQHFYFKTTNSSCGKTGGKQMVGYTSLQATFKLAKMSNMNYLPCIRRLQCTHLCGRWLFLILLVVPLEICNKLSADASVDSDLCMSVPPNSRMFPYHLQAVQEGGRESRKRGMREGVNYFGNER